MVSITFSYFRIFLQSFIYTWVQLFPSYCTLFYIPSPIIVVGMFTPATNEPMSSFPKTHCPTICFVLSIFHSTHFSHFTLCFLYNSIAATASSTGQ